MEIEEGFAPYVIPWNVNASEDAEKYDTLDFYFMSIGDMPFQIDMTCAADVAGKWTHVVFTQDAESRRFGISVNFAPMAFWGIPEGMDLTRDGRLYIGQDEENDDGKRLRGVLDDLCISRKAVRDDNLPWLQTYYEL